MTMLNKRHTEILEELKTVNDILLKSCSHGKLYILIYEHKQDLLREQSGLAGKFFDKLNDEEKQAELTVIFARAKEFFKHRFCYEFLLALLDEYVKDVVASKLTIMPTFEDFIVFAEKTRKCPDFLKAYKDKYLNKEEE